MYYYGTPAWAGGLSYSPQHTPPTTPPGVSASSQPQGPQTAAPHQTCYPQPHPYHPQPQPNMHYGPPPPVIGPQWSYPAQYYAQPTPAYGGQDIGALNRHLGTLEAQLQLSKDEISRLEAVNKYLQEQLLDKDGSKDKKKNFLGGNFIIHASTGEPPVVAPTAQVQQTSTVEPAVVAPFAQAQQTAQSESSSEAVTSGVDSVPSPPSSHESSKQKRAADDALVAAEDHAVPRASEPKRPADNTLAAAEDGAVPTAPTAPLEDPMKPLPRPTEFYPGGAHDWSPSDTSGPPKVAFRKYFPGQADNAPEAEPIKLQGPLRSRVRQSTPLKVISTSSGYGATPKAPLLPSIHATSGDAKTPQRADFTPNMNARTDPALDRSKSDHGQRPNKGRGGQQPQFAKGKYNDKDKPAPGWKSVARELAKDNRTPPNYTDSFNPEESIKSVQVPSFNFTEELYSESTPPANIPRPTEDKRTSSIAVSHLLGDRPFTPAGVPQSPEQKPISERAPSFEADIAKPVKSEDGLLLQPEKDGDSTRTVTIDNLPIKTEDTLRDVMEQVRGGPLVSAKCIDTRKMNGGSSVLLEFVHANDAIAFADDSVTNGFAFKGKPARVALATSSTGPMDSSTTRFIRSGATRCVVVKGLKGSTWFETDKFGDLLGLDAGSHAPQLEDLIGDPDNRSITVIFEEVKVAGNMYEKLIREPALKGCTIRFARDPCDRPLDPPLDSERLEESASRVSESTKSQPVVAEDATAGEEQVNQSQEAGDDAVAVGKSASDSASELSEKTDHPVAERIDESPQPESVMAKAFDTPVVNQSSEVTSALSEELSSAQVKSPRQLDSDMTKALDTPAVNQSSEATSALSEEGSDAQSNSPSQSMATAHLPHTDADNGMATTQCEELDHATLNELLERTRTTAEVVFSTKLMWVLVREMHRKLKESVAVNGGILTDLDGKTAGEIFVGMVEDGVHDDKIGEIVSAEKLDEEVLTNEAIPGQEVHADFSV